MSARRTRPGGSIACRQPDGKRVLVYITRHEFSTADLSGASGWELSHISARTSDGRDVNIVAEDRFEIVVPGGNIPLVPDAPRCDDDEASLADDDE